MALSLTARLDQPPMSKPHHALLLIGCLGHTFDGMDSAVRPDHAGTH